MQSRVLGATKWVLARALAAVGAALLVTLASMALRVVAMTEMTSASSGAGQCVVSQMELSYTDSFSPTMHNYVVAKVRVVNVPTPCWGKTFAITLNSAVVGDGVFRGNTSVVDVNRPVPAGAVQSSGIGVSS